MYYCYKAEVEKRGLVMKNDEHILGAIKDASSWLIEGKKPGLLLYGGIGNGKTTLANAICMYINQLRDYSEPGVYRTTAIIVSRKSMRDETSKYLEELKTKEMFCLDDLGVEAPTVKCYGNDIYRLTEWFYARYDYPLLTLVTRNRNMEQLSERYGSRIADRMEEYFNKIPFTHATYRKKTK